MKNLSILATVAVAMMALASPQTSNAQDCPIKYRIWQDGGNTYYNFGDTILLQQGAKADLYIHTRSRGADPYSTKSDLGAPADFGIGSHSMRDVNRVLRFASKDPSRGKVSLEAIAPGRTGLGYRVNEVFHPGRVQDIPAKCRTGQVHVTVEGRSRDVAQPRGGGAQSSVGEAAHELLSGLFTGILRRKASQVGDYPNDWFDRVENDGLSGLMFVAESMTNSSEFRDAAVDRTRRAMERSGASAQSLGQRQVEDQLLTDIFRSLYGTSLPSGSVRDRLANALGNCLGSNQINACQRFGRDLVSQREYADNHRRLLRHWR